MVTFILGVVALLAGLWMWTKELMGHQLFGLFLKALLAAIPVMFVLGGIVAIIAGISSLKEKAAEEKAPAPEKKEEIPPAQSE